MKPYFTYQSQRKPIKLFLTAMFLVLMSSVASAQLGVYSFTGAGVCPNQNPNITTQPANASFSAFSNTNATCVAATDVFQNNGWNTTATIDLTEYNEFTITPNTYYSLTLTTLSFTHLTDENAVGGTTWALRSSVDGFAADIATGSASTTSQSPTVNLPAANFTNVGAVTFRLYILNANSATASWSVDDVTLGGSVNVIPPANPANPTSNSPQCSTQVYLL